MFMIEWLQMDAVVGREASSLFGLNSVTASALTKAPQMAQRGRCLRPDSFRIKNGAGEVVTYMKLDSALAQSAPATAAMT